MANYSSAATGALSGAATGATIGSAVPVIGTGIGAAGGAIIGGLSGLFGGKKKKRKTLSTLDKRQQKLQKKQYEGLLGQGPMADLYNYDPEKANDVFEKTIANPAYRGFQENVIPGITGQFRSAGLMNSSYAGDAISKAGRDVQESLNAQRSKYLYDAQQMARGARREDLNRFQDRETFMYDVGQKPFDIQSVLKSISPEAVKEIKNYFSKE